MKKELTWVALVTLGILALIFIVLQIDGDQYWILGFGIFTLILDAVLFFVGLVLVLIGSTRKYGQAMLLTSAILLLASFTVCTTLAV